MMILKINPLVVKDLKGIREYIANDNANKAIEMVENIYKVFESIQQFPAMGADLSKRVSFKTNYKYVVWENYIVLYKFGHDYVEIYRVVNRFQDITRIFN